MNAHQQNQADRDVNAPHGDQTVINDNRRVELAADMVPHPAAVSLAGPIAGLPRPPVRVFEGRAEALEVLEAALSARSEAVVTQVVFGLGGVGKSELTLQYAYAHRADYQLVWWITATDAAQLETGLAELARRLCPPVAVVGTTADAASWAVGWMQAHDGWLLIMDNVEDPAHIGPLLAQVGAGHVIITSRRDTDWSQLADPVRLDVLDPSAAARVLIARTGQDGPADATAIAGIAEELGFLPLALDQAAAYIVQQHITSAAYLDSLRRHPARMHAARRTGANAERTVARLWELHITAIRDANAEALRLLGVLALYAPDAIPRAMLGGGAPRENTDEALGLLASYSMIMLTAERVSIHRLLQAVILARLDNTYGARGLRDTALDWVYTAIPDEPQTDTTGWPLLRTLVPHVEALASEFPSSDYSVTLGRVLHVIALFLNSQGDYARASVLGQFALAVTEKAEGPDHIDTAMALANLGDTYQVLGRTADALPLVKRALAITEKAFGPYHPTFANRLNNLAAIYRHLSRLTEALPLAERALAITEETLGPDHLHTAIALGHLAATYSDIGELIHAVPLLERALAITEETFGPDHPRTATALANLSDTYQGLDRMAEALPLAKRALAITEKALGPSHPDTAARISSLAVTYQALGWAAEALPLAKRALAITEKALGPSHPDTAARMSTLAAIHLLLEQPTSALPLQQQALAITEKALGLDHPYVGLALVNLCNTLLFLERVDDALPLAERAVEITEKTLGPGHPGTGAALTCLAEIYRDLGRTTDAVPLEERVTQIHRGTNDQTTASHGVGLL